MAVLERVKETMTQITRLFDAWGQPHAQPAPEQLALPRVPDRVRDRQSLGSLLANVTPQRLLGIFADADNGNIGRQIELARDIMERDGHTRALMQTSNVRVCALEYIVAPGDKSDESMAAAEVCREWWEQIPAQAVLGRLHDAVLQQIAVERVLWDTGATRGGRPYWLPIGSEQIDARKLAFPQADTADHSVVAPRLMIDWNPVNTVPLTPGEHVTHLCDWERSRPGKMALVRAIASAWMIERFAFIDFASLSEQWGKPFLSVLYQQGSSPEEIDAVLAQCVRSLADRVLALPAGAQANVSEGTAHISSPVQEKLIKVCQDLRSKAILGNVTQADAAGNNDSVSSPTHAEIGKQIRDKRARDLAETISRDWFKPWFVWNRSHFGAAARAPRLEPVLSESPDPQKRAPVYQTAAGLVSGGLRVNAEQFYREMGFEKPTDVPEVLVLKGGGPAPGGFGGGLPFGGDPGDRQPWPRPMPMPGEPGAQEDEDPEREEDEG